jgi:Fic-DOC domain mobile mystery protein B
MEAFMGRLIDLEQPEGATPLDPDEANGLIPQHIWTQGQLNEWEQANILDAEKWLNRQRFHLAKVTTTDFIKKLHVRMFGKTWTWAGAFRQSNKNIGVDKFEIAVSLYNLLDDVRYQIECQSYSIAELAARFHHRLVLVHPFANGNGRHARMMTDIILLSQGQKRFTWGRAKNLGEVSPVRERYIKALRAADQHNYESLIAFVQE